MADEPLSTTRCDYTWGDWRCDSQEGHEGKHFLVWAGDEDDE